MLVCTKKKEFVLKETESLHLDSHFLISPEGHGAGGLALLWRSDINIQILSSNRNFINTMITFKNTNFQSTFIYGAPEIHLRQEAWNSLTNIAAPSDSPWFLTGDFNEITSNAEKSGGIERPESSFSNFRTFLSSCDLFDIKHSGNFLSWRGKRGTHLVHCRLDRTLANSSWSDLFPNGRSQYLQFEGSDHRPLISVFNSKKKKPNRLFRYDRRLRDNQEVKAIIDKAWNESPHLSVSKRISRC